MKKLAIIAISILVFIAMTGQMSLTTGVASSSTPLEMPIHTDTWTVTSEYGLREDPIVGGLTMHYGTDLIDTVVANPAIYSAGKGIVLSAYESSSYGLTVVVQHSNNLTTRYAHMSQLYVVEGEEVTSESPLGIMGTTGNSTGIHLHLEVKESGEFRDPRLFINFN